MSDSKSQTNAAPEAAANDVYRGPETKGWWRELCCIPLRMDSRLAVVTGANSGIGLSVTGELARRGATVIMACRDISKAQSAKDSLLRMYGAENPESTKTDVVDETISSILSPIQDEQLRLEQLDLSSFESIRNFVERFIKTNEPLDYLINNAAIISRTYEKSVDGQELQLAVNYLGPVLLTELLLPSLKKSPKGRIVNMTDALHYLGNLHKPTLHLSGSSYGPYVAYNQSKLALTMYTVELARRLEGTSVIPVSVYPGPVNTAFQKSSNSTLEKMYTALTMPQRISPWEAAQQVIHALLRRRLIPGGYYDRYDRGFPDRLALTQLERTWLWDKTKEILQLKE
ncbi:oxidoreductase, short chain dehydrogenase/reductase family protein [Opisthorchis viverrini]|uniref:Oxidoreductase, short chain dehydrogenase/reductase family protein n=1 Tax=Opisthorchis viverrini TaxID=6198 RepID=A0A1S8WWR5_OPIVI|nr:oxidoreductase, short chain dehydrogenase/reductase family protein [Opisthorchis viverrini]